MQGLRIDSLGPLAPSSPCDPYLISAPKILLRLIDFSTIGTPTVEIKTPASLETVKDLSELATHELELYLVRKGPQMAKLGIALIKEAFGQNEETREEYGEQVRQILGGRLLTKDEPEEERFTFGLYGDYNNLVISGYLPVEARKVRVYNSPSVGTIMFEEKGVLPSGFIEAADKCTTTFFKRRSFGEMAFAAERVKDATPEEIRKYLLLKFHYENDKD